MDPSRFAWKQYFARWAHRCRWPVRIHLPLRSHSTGVGRVHFISCCTCCPPASSASAATGGSPTATGQHASPPASACSASSRPPQPHLPSGKTTATVTSGSPAGHCAIAPCVATATWSVSNAVSLASSRALHPTPAMFSDLRRQPLRSRWPYPLWPARPNSRHRSTAARQTPNRWLNSPAMPAFLPPFTPHALPEHKVPAAHRRATGHAILRATIQCP